MKKIGIIGAGPAGMMAAICAKNENNLVTIFERNDFPGKKLLMTGGGRCNITNTAFYDDFLTNVIRNRKFVYSSFTSFDNYALMDFLKQNGLDTIEEDCGRVFPKTEKARDVIAIFQKILKQKSIEVKTNTKIEKVYKDKVFYLTDQNNKTYELDYLIIASGGKSYPRTGSDGLCYDLARKLAHKIINPEPVLTPIFIKDRLGMKAISFSNISLTVKTDKKDESIRGDILFNKNFVTGPAALKASSFISDEDIKGLSVDFFPNITYNELDREILSLSEENSKKNLINALAKLTKTSLLEEVTKRLSINPAMKVSELNRSSRKLIIEYLKNFPLTFDRLGGFETAVVSRGGVSVKEINPKTMESKIVEKLFFVGEILDIDSLTGGYNLQVYFSTGHACGTFIKEVT